MMAGSNTNNRGGYDNDGTITSRLQQHAQPQQQNSASSSVKLYCCGCKSRTATIIALVFLLLGGCLYTAVGIAGLNDLRQRAEGEGYYSYDNYFTRKEDENERLILRFVASIANTPSCGVDSIDMGCMYLPCVSRKNCTGISYHRSHFWFLVQWYWN